jgi:hypothetical protein
MSAQAKGHGGHERTDAHVPALARGLAGLSILVLVAIGLMAWMFDFLAGRDHLVPAPSEMATRRVIPPAPRLQVTPSTDVERLRADEDKRLSTYGWVNKEAGVVRIPIERAMDLLAERSKRR